MDELVLVGATDVTWLSVYSVPLTKISGVPFSITTPCTTPLAVSFVSTCNDTVLPTRLFAWIIASDEDDACDAVNELNCAICAAMSVSDCGFIGS